MYGVVKKSILWAFIFLTFVSGLLFCVFAQMGTVNHIEQFDRRKKTKTDSDEEPNYSCPDMLVNDGGKYKLYFSNANGIDDGANPMVFPSLDEYTQYQQLQEDSGRSCPPPIYSQKEIDVQGKEVYRLYPSPYSVEGGSPSIRLTTDNDRSDDDHDEKDVVPYVDASRENPPFNANQYPGIASLDMDEGVYDELDKVHDKTKRKNKCPSYNAMDSNWGGANFTSGGIKKGKFADNEVYIPMYKNFTAR